MKASRLSQRAPRPSGGMISDFGLKSGDERRADRQVERQGDEQADAGDDSQLRDPDIGGGREGQEAAGDGRRRQGQRAAHALSGGDQRISGSTSTSSRLLRSEPNGELNAEVDAQAHEKRDESHRDEVETVEDQKPAGARRRQTDEHRHQNRRDQTR